MTVINKIFLALFLFVLVSFPVMADDSTIKPGETLNLERCINIALQKNPNITLASNTSKLYPSRASEAKASYLPQFNISSGYSRENPITDSSQGNISNNNYSGNFGINQLIYDFGRTSSAVKIQNLDYKSSKFNIDNAVVQVEYNVKQAYYTALSAKISRDIYVESIKQYEKHLKQALAFFKEGTVSKIDVTTAQVNLSNAQLNYIKANDTYKTSISTLNNVIGIPDAPDYNIADTVTFRHPESIKINEVKIANATEKGTTKADNNSVLKQKVTKTDIIDNLTFNKYEINYEDALKAAIDNRPDLKALIVQEAAANESIKLAKANYFPSMSGFVNYGWGGQQFPLDSGWSVGANLTIPVFNGFLTKYQVKEAKTNLDITKSNTEILKQQLYLQVQQAYITLIDSEKSIPLSEISVKQAKENLELADGRYNVGVGSSVDVVDAETNYDNAQLSYVEAVYNYNTARNNLEKAMGVK